MYLQGRPAEAKLGAAAAAALLARLQALYDSCEEHVDALALKRNRHRAVHGPGSSWAAANVRGFTTAQHAGLLEVVYQMLQQLLKGHEAVQQALLQPAAEYTWQQLPVGAALVGLCSGVPMRTAVHNMLAVPQPGAAKAAMHNTALSCTSHACKHPLMPVTCLTASNPDLCISESAQINSPVLPMHTTVA
jgi:hypothetical protein